MNPKPNQTGDRRRTTPSPWRIPRTSTSPTSSWTWWNMNASDLHLTAGSPPMVRSHGKLQAARLPGPGPRSWCARPIYSILTNDQRQRLETDWQIDLSYSIPGVARFRVNAYFQRDSIGAAFRLIPTEIPAFETLGLPEMLLDFTRKPRGFVIVTGPTGSGKSTTLASMLDRINKERHEHIMTIEDPDRVPPQPPELHRQPARAGLRRPELRARAEGRPAPGPGRDPRRRDARPRDHADRASPRPRPATWSSRRCTPRTPRRPSTASSTCSRPPSRHQVRDPALGGAPGHRDPAAAADGRRLRPRRAPARCWCPTPGVRNLIREGKTHQIYSALQTGGNVGHADHGLGPRRPRPPRGDHHQAGRGPRDEPRRAAPPARLPDRQPFAA